MSDEHESTSPEEVQEEIDELSQEERILVMLREELYEGSWDHMEQDLEDRLEGRPYIFKLHNRIEDDLERIERLKKLENDLDINLSDYIDQAEKEET